MSETPEDPPASSWNTPPIAPDGSMPPLEIENFRFHGTGKEFFGIWIVNLALTLVTLGIYFPWARVRTRRYLYEMTEVAGERFAYHAKPAPLLKGYVLLGGAFLAYTLATNFAPLASLAIAAAFGFIWPWLYVRAARFRTRYSSHRGVRFDFVGSTKESYRVNLWLLFLMPLTIGLIYPYIAKERRSYLWNHLTWGGSQFSTELKTGKFWEAYFLAGFLLTVGAFGVGFLVAFMATPLGSLGIPQSFLQAILTILQTGLTLSLYALSYSIISGAILRHTLEGARLGRISFASDLAIGKLCGIAISNLLLTILTLGFFAPFATIRRTHYLVETTSARYAEGTLDTIVSEAPKSETVAGEVAGDLLDLEIGF